MADERGLAGLDPYDLQDQECARLASWFSGLDDAEWSRPSACEGWRRRDVLAHLVAVEDYFTACLSSSVAELMQRYLATGAASLDDFNAAGVAAAKDRSTAELLSAWLEANQANRAGFRAADGTDIDSSIGAYPCRLQAFHVAFEYAIHADDVDAPVGDEPDTRQGWLAGVARFALTEIKQDLTVEDGADGVFAITSGSERATLDRDTFVAGVAGRIDPGSLPPGAAALLDLGY